MHAFRSTLDSENRVERYESVQDFVVEWLDSSHYVTDLLISVKETTIYSIFHPDAQALFNTCSDLKRVAYELYNTNVALNPEDKAVQLFQAFAPMLCKRPLQAIEATVKKMGGTEFFVEEKLDGERMQLHKRGSEYFYCSRSVNLIVWLCRAIINAIFQIGKEKITLTCTVNTWERVVLLLLSMMLRSTRTWKSTSLSLSSWSLIEKGDPDWY